MRILLIGEYSRLHNSLKEGLTALGHDVTIVGNGDGFKNFPVDINIDATTSKKGFMNLFRQAVWRVFKFDFAKIETGLRFYFHLPKLRDYDVVQLVSETPFQTVLPLEIYLLKKLKRQNKKQFVLASGVDVPFVNALTNGKFRYSMLDPYLADKSRIAEYRHLLAYFEKRYRQHHREVYEIVNGAIATDLDYAIAMNGNPKYIGLIPNPVNVAKIPYEENTVRDKVVIFHGINRWNYFKKGSGFFEKALAEIATKYGDKVEIITAETLPYDEYIKVYKRAHILLDQIYAVDQGYNALEGMARGKVVFTGAEKEFQEHYNLSEKVAINALPDVAQILNELSFLIENPTEIDAIGKRARAFVEKEHDFLKIAAEYVAKWTEY
ncbi:MAG: glycosyltransferase family 1 protein [Flavobacterium sp.]|nr:MAG: glycosyltransferase family 1 protein [Flavobacterium sp.]